jgi:hypothetical protein
MSITISVDIPERMYDKLSQKILDTEKLDINSVVSQAIAIWLMQNGDTSKDTTATYLDSLMEKI